MAYQHGQTSLGPTILTVEQARRRNAELRIELAALDTEKLQLEAKARVLRTELSSAYRALRRQVTDLDAVRAQTDSIAKAAQFVSTLPEPKYGGREGLQAAADEMAEHEAKGLKLGKPRRHKGPSHGTRDKYAEGCRCDECRAWRTAASSRYRSNRKRRREQLNA